MAEGHARLSLRESKVSIFDALAAIKLYEENMTHCSSSGWTSFVLEPTLTQLSNGHEKVEGLPCSKQSCATFLFSDQ